MTVTIRRGLFIWLLAMSVLSPLLVGVAGIVYTGYVQRQTEHRFAVQQAKAAAEVAQTNARWCALFVTLDSPQEPVTTERGRVIQDKIRDLRLQLRCEAK